MNSRNMMAQIGGMCCTCKSFTKANSVSHWVHICNQATSRCYSEVRTYYSNACSKYDPLQKDKPAKEPNTTKPFPRLLMVIK